MPLPFQISEECHSTTHSLLKGLSSLYFSILSSVILHCSINSCFWEGVDVACQTFLLSSCIVLSFHTTTRKLLYRNSLLWEGIDFIYIYTHKFLSISSIILHVSPIPNFRRMPFDHSFLSKGLEFRNLCKDPSQLIIKYFTSIYYFNYF